jgi:hydroxyacylglutathione hydrolase
MTSDMTSDMTSNRSDPGGQPNEAAPVVECISNGRFQANCYLVTCPRTRDTLVIDPGAEPERILDRIHASGGRVVRVLHTHGHFDHIGATEAVLAGLAERVPLAAHPADRYLYERAARVPGAGYGYPVPDLLALPDEPLADGDALEVGDLRLEVIHTPGHTPGSISLRCGDSCVFTGDTLFRRGIGRTDLPGGDEDAIYQSILSRLYPLPEALIVYPGHEPSTTIGEERRGNPFVQAGAESTSPPQARNE